jgi:hypothetical protein
VDCEPTEADRLGRLAADVDQLVRRLRSLGRSSWESRRSSVRALLGDLADISARAEGRPFSAVPDLPDHGLADAVAVISGDLLEVLIPRTCADLLQEAQEVIGRALEETK